MTLLIKPIKMFWTAGGGHKHERWFWKGVVMFNLLFVWYSIKFYRRKSRFEFLGMSNSKLPVLGLDVKSGTIDSEPEQVDTPLGLKLNTVNLSFWVGKNMPFTCSVLQAWSELMNWLYWVAIFMVHTLLSTPAGLLSTLKLWIWGRTTKNSWKSDCWVQGILHVSSWYFSPIPVLVS